MKKILLTTFTALILLPFRPASANERETILLNDDWKFVYGYEVANNAGKTVQLPHTWNDEDALSGKIDYYRGDGNYFKKLHAKSEWEGKRLFLRFDGANTVCDLFINHVHVGHHRGGYTAFIFEITDYLDYGKDNEIWVRVSNARQLDVMPLVGDFTVYGGIYRDLNLLITNQSCISPLDYASPGVYLEQKDVSGKSATVNAKVLVSNGSGESKSYRINVEVSDGEKVILSKESDLHIAGKSEDAVSIPFFIDNPTLWNGRKNPFCYAVTVSLKQDGKVVDVVEQPLGLRYFSVDADEGFFLNGKHLQLRGVCRHQDRDGIGSAKSRSDHDEDLALIMETGANAIRLAHYPHAGYFYDLLDKSGLVAWAEIPFVGPGGYRDHGFIDTPEFRANGIQQLLEMIRQNYNHPSICFWGIFNELKFDAISPIEYLRELDMLAKKEDASRLTVSASFIDKAELNEITDLIGWNKYFGWYTNSSGTDLGTWVDRIHRDSPQLKISISEYGAGASIKHHQEELARVAASGKWHPEEWQSYCHEKNWEAINERPFIWGSFVWNFFDFCSAFRDEGDRAGINDKGLVTFDRKTKKDAWWFYKAAWSDEPVLHITSKRFVDRKNADTYVKVYTNQKEVELFVNNEPLGKKSPENSVVQWDVKLKKGENIIEAKSGGKKNLLNDRCCWILKEL